MARLMLSAGMFSALAAAMAPRRRGLPSGSPPPCLAAMVISLMRRQQDLSRFGAQAPLFFFTVPPFSGPDLGDSCRDFSLRRAARPCAVWTVGSGGSFV